MPRQSPLEEGEHAGGDTDDDVMMIDEVEGNKGRSLGRRDVGRGRRSRSRLIYLRHRVTLYVIAFTHGFYLPGQKAAGKKENEGELKAAAEAGTGGEREAGAEMEDLAEKETGTGRGTRSGMRRRGRRRRRRPGTRTRRRIARRKGFQR